MAEPGRQGDAQQRHRAGAEEHPERQPGVHGAELPVPHRAEALEDRAVENVGADRERRLEAEEDDQDRRQQRAAAHPRQAYKQTDQETAERELPGHWPAMTSTSVATPRTIPAPANTSAARSASGA